MKNNLTEMLFILDSSGSMHGTEADVLGGFNSMIEKQKQEDGRAFVTTVVFNTDCRTVHDRLDINSVPPLGDRDYCPCGCTALLDAVAGSIKHISHIHKYSRPEDVPEKTVVVIATDGMENASRRYSLSQVKELIEKEQTKYGWEFIFLGANIDAIGTAQSMGITADRAANFNCDDEGLELCFAAVSDAVSSVQRRAPVGHSWKQAVAADHAARKSKR